MKIAKLVQEWEPGDWPALKKILLELADDQDLLPEPPPEKKEP